ncbi:MAG: TonB family protein [Alistipes sp.]|nr:TonB family protein [Alistipes sp.]
MEYYNPIDNSSKRYAAAVTLVVMVLVGVLISQLSIIVELRNAEDYAIEIEYVEPEEASQPDKRQEAAKVEQPKTTTTRTDSKQAYEQESKDNTRNQTSGQEEQTQTLNPNALFKPTAGTTADQEVVHGNRLAPEGESESHKGEGTGLNVIGDIELDGGLQSRGVVAGYPRPKGNNAVGRVVVEIVVDSDGKVISANIRQQGTTTSDQTLRNNALKAARNTKFKPDPTRMTQSGTISYKYNVN